MKIFITGCAKSGTTLLLRLMNAFDINVYETSTVTEISIDGFVELEEKNIVGKRIYSSIFSSELSGKEILRQADLIIKNKIGILNIVRDGRDVILSEVDGELYVSPVRWIDSIVQSEVFSDIVSLQIKYEDIINNPLSVQGSIQQVFGLERKHYFTTYPDFVKEVYVSKDKVYKLRPLSDENISKDIDAYKSICEDESILSGFECMLNKLKYI